MTLRALLASLVILTAAATPMAPPTALAAPNVSAADAKKAVSLYKQGRQLVAQRKYEPALTVLDEALALMPSPNTELLKAQALRELGRLGEAMASYQRAQTGASAKVAKGEKRYQRTLEEAGRWSAALSAKVGELVIVVNNAPPGVTLTVGGAVVETDKDSSTDILAARIWREPGAVAVVVRSDDGREVTQEATITTSGNATVTLTFPELEATPVDPIDPDPVPPEEEEDSGPFPMPPLPSTIAAGVGVVGFGLFGIFGAMSSSTASDLDECTPRCPNDLREDADAARTEQTVANVGLIVGITGLTAAAAIWLVTGLTAEPSDEPDAVSLHVGPGGLGLSGRF